MGIFSLRQRCTLRFKIFRVRSKHEYFRSRVSTCERYSSNFSRIFEQKIESKLAVERVFGKGKGVVATEWFEKDDFLLRYYGKLTSRKEGLRREKALERRGKSDSFLYFFKCDSKSYCVDATFDDGRKGRLVNHSRIRPNCRMRVFLVNGEPALVLVATRDIMPGEEVLYDYGERRPEKLNEFPWIQNS